MKYIGYLYYLHYLFSWPMILAEHVADHNTWGFYRDTMEHKGAQFIAFLILVVGFVYWFCQTFAILYVIALMVGAG